MKVQCNNATLICSGCDHRLPHNKNEDCIEKECFFSKLVSECVEVKEC